MKKMNTFSKKLLKNNSGQGATEYILLLVVIVGLVMIFGGKIKETMKAKIDDLSASIMSVNGQ